MRLALRIAAAAAVVLAVVIATAPRPATPADTLPAVTTTTAASTTTVLIPPTFPTWTVEEILASPEGAALVYRREIDALIARREQEATVRALREEAGSRAPVGDLGPPSPEARPTIPASSPSSPTVWPAAVEQWRDLIVRYFTAADVEMALGVLACESSGDPGATNPSSGCAGLFQHRPRYWAERSAAAGWAGADIYDPTANVAVAAWLVRTDGWWHWGNGDPCEARARAALR